MSVNVPPNSLPPSRPVPILSLITDRRLLLGRTVDDVVKEAVAGGVNHVQLRELDLNARELLTLAEWMKEVIGARAVFVVHERVDVALACEADGVHLSPHSLPTRVVRQLVGSQRLIGRTVATISEAVRAARDGADYVQLGPVFATNQPRMKLLGLGSIEVAVREVTVPLLAAGGIDSSNAGQLITVGVAGVAVRTSIMKASDPGAAAQALHSQIELALTGERSA